MWISQATDLAAFELDEIFWFINKRRGQENGINTYVMTMISREPRQIVAFAVDNAKSQARIQAMTDSAPAAEKYYTDGYRGYGEIIFPGLHISNSRNKSDTHLIESVNADLRHYISGLHRKSRTFYRTLETFHVVLSVFVDAYNKFGEKKRQFYDLRPSFKSDLPFSVLDFL